MIFDPEYIIKMEMVLAGKDKIDNEIYKLLRSVAM
jgi:hypothetical protein